MNEQLKPNVERQTLSTQTEAPLVELSRTFRAPVNSVWAAWSQPTLVQQWWGPEQFTSPKAEIDFKEGGKFKWAMKSPEGVVNWSVGSVTKIVPNQKIVFSETFGNEQGEAITPKEAGMENWDGDYHGTITVEFQSLGANETKLLIHHTGIPAHLHDECVEGWNSSLNKLQRLVERH